MKILFVFLTILMFLNFIYDTYRRHKLECNGFLKIKFDEFVKYYKMAPNKWRTGKNFSVSSFDVDYKKEDYCDSYTLIYTAGTKKVKKFSVWTGGGYYYYDDVPVRYFFYVSGMDKYRLNHLWKTVERQKIDSENNKLKVEAIGYPQRDINEYSDKYLKELEEEKKKIEDFQNRIRNLKFN